MHSMPIATSYWVMMNAFDYKVPSLVVIDLYRLDDNAKSSDTNLNFLHDAFDGFPLTSTKIKAVYDLTLNSEQEVMSGEKYKEHSLDYIIDLIPYHDRWRDLSFSIPRKYTNIQKGAEYYYEVSEINQEPYSMTNERIDEASINLVYLRKMIEECQARNIDILLVTLPWSGNNANLIDSTAYSLSKEYGINYLGYDIISQQVDYSTDFYNSGHLNYQGGKKITRYIGEYIRNNYDLDNHKGDRKYRKWDDDLKIYSIE